MGGMIKCEVCGKILHSLSRHDFVKCDCENGAFVDGGDSYMRVGGMDLTKITTIPHKHLKDGKVELIYLKQSQLKSGYLYKIIARNASYGIWWPKKKGFIISRYKFNENFVFVEYHWDCQAFATAKPLRMIEESPFNLSKIESNIHKHEKEILEYLNKFV